MEIKIELRIKSADLGGVCRLHMHAATQVSVQAGPKHVPHRFSMQEQREGYSTWDFDVYMCMCIRHWYEPYTW